MASMRARKMSATLCVTNAGLRGSADQRSQPGGDPEAGLDGGEQHDAAIGRHTSTIERGGDFLALHSTVGPPGPCGPSR